MPFATGKDIPRVMKVKLKSKIVKFLLFGEKEIQCDFFV